MNEKIELFENEIMGLVESIFIKHQDSLDELFLKPRVSELKKTGVGDTYTSEATIFFDDLKKMDHGRADLADIMEFFVFKNGRPIAGIDEITSWLEAAIVDVLRRRKQKLQTWK